MEVELRNKEENKEVSLGTSKANYMDPRITVACCVETNQCVGCYHFSAMTRPTWLGPSSRRRVDGVEDDAMIQHERAVKF